MLKTISLVLVVLTLAMAGCKSSTPVVSGPSAAQLLEFNDKFFEAQKEKMKGNTERSFALFSECATINPSSGAVNYELAGLSLSVKRDLLSAQKFIKNALLANPANSWYHKLSAHIWIESGKNDLAVKNLKEAYRLNPADAEVLIELVNLYIGQKKYEEAIATMNEIQKSTGPSEELAFQKHQLYLQKGDTKKAGEELEELAKAFPEEARYWGLAAQYYQQIGNTEKAADALKKMVDADPNNGQVHYQLSEYYAAQGKDEESFQELKKAFNTHDINIDQKINVMLKYFKITESSASYLSQAYQLLEILTKIDEGEAKTWSMNGDFLYRDRRDEEALVSYRKALELDPKRNIIWTQVIGIELELKMYSALIRDAARASELFPNQPQFYFYHGVALSQMNKPQEAIDQLNIGKELVVEDDQFLFQFYSYLGMLYNQTNQFKLSDESYDLALKIDPTNATTLNNYSYYLAVRNVNLDKAAEMIALCNSLSPNQASFEDTYAWILFRQAKYDKALEWITKAYQHDGSSFEIIEHFGDILYRLNRQSEALAKWREAKTKGASGPVIESKITSGKLAD